MHFVVYDARFSEEFFLRAHLRPLERGKWLRNKEGGTCNDLHLSVSLVLRDLVILLRDLLGKQGDPFHIFDRLRRKSEHEIELYTVPAALERQRRTVQDIFLGKALIDDVSEALGACLRRKGKAALLDILHLAHNVEGERVDTQGRKGNIHALSVECVDQEGNKFLKAAVITGT